MKSFHVVLLALAATVFTATLASAHPVTPRVDRHQARQHARIQQGVRSGELTRGEIRMLRAGQRHVARLERRAKADGFVSMRERVQIRRAQARQHRMIFRFKHNGAVI